MGGRFKPHGAQPKWRAVYDLALKRSPGDIITYAELTEVLGYDPSVPNGNRGPIYAASKRLLREHNRTFVVVTGEGYRVARADEHHGLAKTQQKFARRRIGKAVDLVNHVDREALTARQQAAIDSLGHVLMAQNAMLARHDARIGDVEKDVRRVDDRVEVLEAVLAQHGIKVPERKIIEGETAGNEEPPAAKET